MNTSVDLCGVTLKNPVMTASGTFGSGAEYSEFVDLNKLGAVVTKGSCQCAMGGKSHPPGGRGLRRNAQCGRFTESGN